MPQEQFISPAITLAGWSKAAEGKRQTLHSQYGGSPPSLSTASTGTHGSTIVFALMCDLWLFQSAITYTKYLSFSLGTQTMYIYLSFHCQV